MAFFGPTFQGSHAGYEPEPDQVVNEKDCDQAAEALPTRREKPRRARAFVEEATLPNCSPKQGTLQIVPERVGAGTAAEETRQADNLMHSARCGPCVRPRLYEHHSRVAPQPACPIELPLPVDRGRKTRYQDCRASSEEGLEIRRMPSAGKHQLRSLLHAAHMRVAHRTSERGRLSRGEGPRIASSRPV